jgi:hypothetical protein
MPILKEDDIFAWTEEDGNETSYNFKNFIKNSFKFFFLICLWK